MMIGNRKKYGTFFGVILTPSKTWLTGIINWKSLGLKPGLLGQNVIALPLAPPPKPKNHLEKALNLIWVSPVARQWIDDCVDTINLPPKKPPKRHLIKFQWNVFMSFKIFSITITYSILSEIFLVCAVRMSPIKISNNHEFYS